MSPYFCVCRSQPDRLPDTLPWEMITFPGAENNREAVALEEIHTNLLSNLNPLFVHSYLLNYSIVLKLCTEHGSITAVLCAKFPNDWTTEIIALDERVSARFEFKMSLGCVWIQQPACKFPPIRWLFIGLRPAYERRRYFVMTFLTGWAQT